MDINLRLFRTGYKQVDSLTQDRIMYLLIQTQLQALCMGESLNLVLIMSKCIYM